MLTARRTVRRFTPRHRPAALVTTAAAAVIGVGMAATPASAHTQVWSVTCSQATVDLTDYTVQVINTVVITADGKQLAPEFTFRDEFHHVYAIPAHTDPAGIHILVTAGDGGDTWEDTKIAPVCGEESQSPTPTETPTAATPTPASTSTPSSTSATPAPNAPSAAGGGASPADSAPPLAETGASSTTPLIAGTAGVVVAAGGALVLVSRRRRGIRS